VYAKKPLLPGNSLQPDFNDRDRGLRPAHDCSGYSVCDRFDAVDSLARLWCCVYSIQRPLLTRYNRNSITDVEACGATYDCSGYPDCDRFDVVDSLARLRCVCLVDSETDASRNSLPSGSSRCFGTRVVAQSPTGPAGVPLPCLRRASLGRQSVDQSSAVGSTSREELQTDRFHHRGRALRLRRRSAP